ncbi:vancomycin high temperature exclusion protein [Flavobacterium sp. ASW18X]|uniref:SanA/YdcF family protein n=1 Tax=Flavobacterium sp. ASW18X TaxID=2572595 RepID=UPI003516A6BD
MKRITKILGALIALTLICVVTCNGIIETNAKNKTYSATKNMPTNKVGLLLGTAKWLKQGGINPYFEYRIRATVALFKANKIEYVLVSGDNGTQYYNEPSEFKKELVKKGIPAERIILDYAGFRTLDSVVRAKEVFGQTSITIISQEFHNERAIYLAENHGLKAIGFNAKTVKGRNGLKTQLREYFARTKVFLDILFQVKPKFLGEKIDI